MEVIEIQVVECKLTVAEGRERKVIKHIITGIKESDGCEVNYVDIHRRDNYTVISFYGSPDSVMIGAYHAVDIAIDKMDIRLYRGKKRLKGVVDTIYLSPITELNVADCIEIASKIGSSILEQMDVPVCYNSVECQYRGDTIPKGHITAGMITIEAGGTTSGAEAIKISLNIELQRELSDAKLMCSAPRVTTRLVGCTRFVYALMMGTLKTIIYSWSWGV